MKARKATIVVLVTAAMALWTLAAQAQDKDDQPRAGKTTTVTGCLEKGDEPNEFHLIADNGKRYEVRGDKVALAEHVGHKITVTGTTVKESEKEERQEQRHNEAAEHNAGNLEVSNVQMVSTSCR